MLDNAERWLPEAIIGIIAGGWGIIRKQDLGRISKLEAAVESISKSEERIYDKIEEHARESRAQLEASEARKELRLAKLETTIGENHREVTRLIVENLK